MLRSLSPERTLLIATHRLSVLEAADRVIVVDGGAIVMDGPRVDVLARLRKAAAANGNLGTPNTRPTGKQEGSTV
jgi:ATP-binding cassette subfamily C protein LapB